MADGGDVDRREPSSYVPGERVFGPPLGSFDVDWVAREVERSTGASFRDAHRAVELAWQSARTAQVVDETVIGTALMLAGLDEHLTDAVTEYVVAYCHAYDVDPAAR